jgi:hypothetical protein
MSLNSEYDKSFRGGRHKHEVVSNVSTYMVGSLPGGGGSGGGDDCKALGTVDPQGVPGLNSIFVFGENLQTAVGLNHQLAVGSNLQICVNPIALAQVLGLPLPVGISAALGSGVGGNIQLTLGTSTNIVLGLLTLTSETRPTSSATLVEAQRNWLLFRDAEYLLIDSIYETLPSQEYQLLHAYWRLRLTRERALLLKNYLALASS